MMEPTHKLSRARRGNRRSHDRLTAAHTTTCPNCGSPKLPHAACRSCGYVRPGLSLKRQEAE